MSCTHRSPSPSAEYPANGGIVFSNIVIAWEGVVSSNPAWTAQTYQPACNSLAKVVDNSTIAFTWDTSAEMEAQVPRQQLRGNKRA